MHSTQQSRLELSRENVFNSSGALSTLNHYTFHNRFTSFIHKLSAHSLFMHHNEPKSCTFQLCYHSILHAMLGSLCSVLVLFFTLVIYAVMSFIAFLPFIRRRRVGRHQQHASGNFHSMLHHLQCNDFFTLLHNISSFSASY